LEFFFGIFFLSAFPKRSGTPEILFPNPLFPHFASFYRFSLSRASKMDEDDPYAHMNFGSSSDESSISDAGILGGLGDSEITLEWLNKLGEDPHRRPLPDQDVQNTPSDLLFPDSQLSHKGATETRVPKPRKTPLVQTCTPTVVQWSPTPSVNGGALPAPAPAPAAAPAVETKKTETLRAATKKESATLAELAALGAHLTDDVIQTLEKALNKDEWGVDR
jgi:hypothetical protein